MIKKFINAMENFKDFTLSTNGKVQKKVKKVTLAEHKRSLHGEVTMTMPYVGPLF